MESGIYLQYSPAVLVELRVRGWIWIRRQGSEEILVRKETLYERRRRRWWPQPGGEGREMKNDTIAHNSWSVCVCCTAVGSLTGPYKDYSKCLACCFFCFTLLLIDSLSLSSYRILISLSLSPPFSEEVRHQSLCRVIEATVLHVLLSVPQRERGMMNARGFLTVVWVASASPF